MPATEGRGWYPWCLLGQVLGRVLGYADAEVAPQDFTVAPAAAVPKALAAAGIQQRDVEYWEINEAFSVVDLVNMQLLGLDADRWLRLPAISQIVASSKRTRHDA